MIVTFKCMESQSVSSNYKSTFFATLWLSSLQGSFCPREYRRQVVATFSKGSSWILRSELCFRIESRIFTVYRRKLRTSSGTIKPFSMFEGKIITERCVFISVLAKWKDEAGARQSWDLRTWFPIEQHHFWSMSIYSHNIPSSSSQFLNQSHLILLC